MSSLIISSNHSIRLTEHRAPRFLKFASINYARTTALWEQKSIISRIQAIFLAIAETFQKTAVIGLNLCISLANRIHPLFFKPALLAPNASQVEIPQIQPEPLEQEPGAPAPSMPSLAPVLDDDQEDQPGSLGEVILPPEPLLVNPQGEEEPGALSHLPAHPDVIKGPELARGYPKKTLAALAGLVAVAGYLYISKTFAGAASERLLALPLPEAVKEDISGSFFPRVASTLSDYLPLGKLKFFGKLGFLFSFCIGYHRFMTAPNIKRVQFPPSLLKRELVETVPCNRDLKAEDFPKEIVDLVGIVGDINTLPQISIVRSNAADGSRLSTIPLGNFVEHPINIGTDETGKPFIAFPLTIKNYAACNKNTYPEETLIVELYQNPTDYCIHSKDLPGQFLHTHCRIPVNALLVRDYGQMNPAKFADLKQIFEGTHPSVVLGLPNAPVKKAALADDSASQAAPLYPVLNR